MRYLNDSNLQIKDLLPVSNNQLMLTYCYDENVSPIKPDLSVLIASHVTCYARVTLFEKILEIESVCQGDIKNDLVQTFIIYINNISNTSITTILQYFSFTSTPTQLY